MNKQTLTSSGLAGLAMVALGSVMNMLAASDYIGASIALILGFGLLLFKYKAGF